jgi:iron-sulfur cluster assembly protein
MEAEMSATTETKTASVAPAKPARRALPPLMRLSDAAAERLARMYSGAQAGMLLRISVNTKGCSGMAYDMSWVEAAGPTDEVVTDKGQTVLVDRKASLFLIGTEMDYTVEKLTSGFTFVNPNEKGRCGCGESFHV